MGGYSPVLRPGGWLEVIDMHRAIAHSLSELRSEWASWISLWSFLAHLNDLDFYKGLDQELEICIAPSRRAGACGERTSRLESIGERNVNISQKSVEESGKDSRGITYTSRGHTMNILFLTSAHNSLSQRLWIELTERGHHVAVALATSDEAMLTAVADRAPDLVIAPMLKIAIPEATVKT